VNRRQQGLPSLQELYVPLAYQRNTLISFVAGMSGGMQGALTLT